MDGNMWRAESAASLENHNTTHSTKIVYVSRINVSTACLSFSSILVMQAAWLRNSETNFGDTGLTL